MVARKSTSSWTTTEQELKSEEYEDGPQHPHSDSGPAGISLHVGAISIVSSPTPSCGTGFTGAILGVKNCQLL